MGNLKWYKRDPRAALVGMSSLTLEERGAYNTILDLIYCHDGALEDDERGVSHMMQVERRVWRRLRLRLLSLGKLYVQDGKIRNKRADTEVISAQLRSEVGRTYAQKRWSGPKLIKGLGDGSPMLTTTRYLERKVKEWPK